MKLPRTSSRPAFANKRAATIADPAAGIGHNVPDFSHIVADRIEKVPIASLQPAKRQVRKHSPAQLAKLMGSISAFGFLVPIIADENNTIISGHARWEAAKQRGLPEVPVVRVEHLSEDEKRAFALAAEKLSELGEWNKRELALELKDLLQVDFSFELDILGFSTPEIDITIAEGLEETKADDAADAVPDPVAGPATTRAGDLFLLGPHRLLCGNALEGASFERLLEGAKARMALTDPPYNVPVNGFVGGLGKTKHREFAMASGEMTAGEFQGFLAAFLGHTAAHLVDGGLAYVFMDWRGQLPLMLAADAVRLKPLNLCVWDKMSGGMGSFYRSAHELCWVYKQGSAPHINNVELGRHGRYRTNLWQHPGMSSFGRERKEALAIHPTVKPTGLLVEAIKDCTKRGDIVLDPFLGSGSTLIAAEKTGRVCRGIELDAIYCDTIIRRYETLTGSQAVHAASGLTFAQLAEQRAGEETAVSGGGDGRVGVQARSSEGSITLDASAASASHALPVRHRSRPVASAVARAVGGEHA